MSDCGTRAISIIAFIGSVFSPWYRWSGRKSPDNHVCINVATYGPGGRWTMTDRGRSALRQSPERFEVGPSVLHWDGDRLVVEINEISTPHGQRVQGTVTIHPSALTSVEVPLTADGAHVWRPFAPTAEIEVDLGKDGWSWRGHGYFDANFGTRALEEDFGYWTWGRYPTRVGTASFYDVARRDGSDLAVALSFGRDGSVETLEAPPKTRFSRSLWAIKRETRADPGTKPRQVKHMLDAPFYNRCGVETTLHGERVTGVFEALDLDRFRGPWLMPMLAVRVPRRSKWAFKD
ncbi:carotenoid 1,2-hydratase [Dinoroseobacter shibae]|uniref:carotenoid 1,2-hydratase n=1 Tax=Dinoroseobacter shibae TaxID=215813 RepID=UPI0005C6478B|nr:carotenoid 1,2-hydratase [Dinoroseobacter shibae]